jgi:cellulose 1,4-beta-cellobiosidase
MGNLLLSVFLGIVVMGCGGATPTVLLEDNAAASPDDAGEEVGAPGDSAADSTMPPFEAAMEAAVDAQGSHDAESGADVAPCAPCVLTVDYYTPTPTAQTEQIQPNIEILNTGAAAQDLAAVTVRYWFNTDGSNSQAFNCDYASSSSATAPLTCTGDPEPMAMFVPLPTPTATANAYMQLSFSGGTIPGGGGTAVIELQFHDADYATFTQTNDYSFNGTYTAFTPWDRITMYVDGALVWGFEP